MAKVTMGFSSVVMVMVAVSLVGGAAAASFPLDCVSYVLDGRAEPLIFCCMEVADQFVLKKSQGISGYCKAVTAINRFNRRLVGTELSLASSIPDKCDLGSYYKKGSLCAGKLISGGV